MEDKNANINLRNSQEKHEDDPGVSSDEENDTGGTKKGRRKIKIEFIEDKSRRHITFSKRKAGIMKKVRILNHKRKKCPEGLKNLRAGLRTSHTYRNSGIATGG